MTQQPKESVKSVGHTPTPWEVDVMGYLRGPNNENILEVKENAGFIVRCVNSHQALLEAAKKAHEMFVHELHPELSSVDVSGNIKFLCFLCKATSLAETERGE